LYADHMTQSIERAIGETSRRRALQVAYNKEHGITPKTIIKKIQDITEQMRTEHAKTVSGLLEIDKKMFEKDRTRLIRQKEKQMDGAVKILDFETAAILRDEILELQKLITQPKPTKKKKQIYE